jgi:diguanylate cyclase (GGDEF)-like protein
MNVSWRTDGRKFNATLARMENAKSMPGAAPSTPLSAVESEQSLTAVLGQAEHVQELVEQSAKELSSVNNGLAEETKLSAGTSGVRRVLEKSQAVESKVQEAADKLSAVNVALEAEVLARHALEAELLTVTHDEEVARHAAFHDPLTGLPNRALFDNRLEHGLAQARRHDRTLAVMFLDLDGFKKINDGHGHDVGDAVLQLIAERLKENTRDDDTVCRLGGDEFLYLLTEIEGDQDAVQIAENIARAIRMPCKLSVGELIVNTSIGIARFPKDGNSAAELIKGADTAMYQAKRNRSGYAFAS